MHTVYSLNGDTIIPFYSVQEWMDHWDELFERVEIDNETVGVYDNNNYCLFAPLSDWMNDTDTDPYQLSVVRSIAKDQAAQYSA